VTQQKTRPPKPIVLDRNDIVIASAMAWARADDERRPQESREHAREFANKLGDVLCYQEFGAAPGDTVRLCPIGFRMPGCYVDMVENFLLDLGGEAAAWSAVHVMVARMAAQYIDNDDYSTDFRLECLDSLNLILGSLKEYAECEAE
jgi:hypothetical protein